MNKTITLGKYVFVLYGGVKPHKSTVGIENETEDCYFVPFMDYDNIEYTKVQKDLVHLNKTFGLCWFMIITSGEQKIHEKTIGNYMVLGIDKIGFHEHMKMLRHTRCDRKYIQVADMYSARNWVIRIAAKVNPDKSISRVVPWVKEIIDFNNSCSYDHSYAHHGIYRKLWNIPSLKRNWDKIESMSMIQYLTR